MTRKATPISTRKADDLDDLPKDLADAIDRLPILNMVHSANLSTYETPRFEDPVEDLTYQAKTVFWRLRILAELGNDSATKALRDLGVNVANTLKDIGQAQRPDPDSRATKAADLEFPDVITLRGDFSEINQLLETRLDEFANELTTTVRTPLYPSLLPSRTFVIDVIESLHWRNDRARRLRAIMSQTYTQANQMALKYPLEMLRILAMTELSDECHSERDAFQMAAECAIHDAIRIRLERRLKELSPAAAAKTCRRIAAKSLSWPTCYSTISEEQRANQSACEDLQLGEAIPFRLYRKVGTPRKLDPDSATRFALNYCIELFETRESLRLSPDRLAYLTEGQEAARDRLKLEKSVRFYELERAWKLAAYKLPDFPRSNTGEKSSASLAAWHHATMLRAESECRGEWDSYSTWPSCVTRRAAEKRRSRSFKEAVSFCLDRGIHNLTY